MKKQFLSFTLLLALSTWIAQAATVRGTVSDTAATRRSRYGWL